MNVLSLTSLVDVVSKAGTPKMTCVANIKRQLAEQYDPATDFYKPLREAIVEAHAEGKGLNHIKTLLSRISDGKKLKNYPPLVDGYVKWLGRKAVAWSPPPSSEWVASGDFAVRVNPELGLVINGVPHIIKLYFKAEPLTKNRVDIITHLMHQQFSTQPAGTSFGVLDVRNKKLIVSAPPPNLSALLLGEMAYVAAIWPLV